jgi:hypothetical protein
MSMAAIGSVQITLSRAPETSAFRALRVRRAGSGHYSPLRSSTRTPSLGRGVAGDGAGGFESDIAVIPQGQESPASTGRRR